MFVLQLVSERKARHAALAALETSSWTLVGVMGRGRSNLATAGSTEEQMGGGVIGIDANGGREGAS